jgi:hypothetical protein
MTSTIPSSVATARLCIGEIADRQANRDNNKRLSD